jgi:aldehyde:ferredoxin oxidoreductase
MKPKGGYAGKILRINLTSQTFAIEELSERDLLLYAGGRGLGIKLLYDGFSCGISPLSPENRLIFMSGPLTGTPFISTGRWMVMTKSPLTGAYIRSVSGGMLGVEMKRAGFDALVVEGAAASPMQIYIHDERVEFLNASNYWGLTTGIAQERIKTELGLKKGAVACIGPAGENLVRFSAIVNDRRTASRGGVGAVMGSKKLKAVVINGDKDIPLADRQASLELAKEQARVMKEHPVFHDFSQKGTAMLEWIDSVGMLPVKNFQGLTLPGIDNLYSDRFSEIRVKHVACYNCILHCGKIYKVKEGKYAGAVSEGPEYESMFALGSLVGNTDIGLTIAADALCDDYGLDTISTGGVIAFSMELYEKGLLRERDADGYELHWGNGEVIYDLIKKIALREGFGDLLADGTRLAAEKMGKGTEYFAMQVKGLEIPGYEPRGAMAHALNYATSNVGANHCVGYSSGEIVGMPEPIDPFTTEGKGHLAKSNQDRTAAYETGIACLFPTMFGMIPLGFYGQMLSRATGIDDFSDEQYLLRLGERIWNLERLFNLREGFGRGDDTLPRRFTEEPLPEGPRKGHTVDLERMLKEYYQARGWNSESGAPTEEKLKDLEIFV